mgnify:CR=1 FL=1
MFKLIASDMDGTLLDENGQVPPETYELILALHEHGVHFAASSGRRYDRLCEFFAPVRDKMDFVAANGAQVYADGKMVDREVYSHLAIRRLAQAVRTFPNLHLALFDRTKSFLLDDECKFVREVDKDLPNAERIWELPDSSVNIIKASIFAMTVPLWTVPTYCSASLASSLPLRLLETMDRCHAARCVESLGNRAAHGALWRRTRRGHGVWRLDERLRDHSLCRHGLRDGNARPALKAVADRVVGCNRDHAVQQELRRVLESLS